MINTSENSIAFGTSCYRNQLSSLTLILSTFWQPFSSNCFSWMSRKLKRISRLSRSILMSRVKRRKKRKSPEACHKKGRFKEKCDKIFCFEAVRRKIWSFELFLEESYEQALLIFIQPFVKQEFENPRASAKRNNSLKLFSAGCRRRTFDEIGIKTERNIFRYPAVSW